MNEIDTVLFDKTGTLTRERPEVGKLIRAYIAQAIEREIETWRKGNG